MSVHTPSNSLDSTPSDAVERNQSPMDFHARLNEAGGDVSFRKLGGLTDTHPETVRRYMQGHAPSATFMTNLCQVLGISGEWLLTGKGPMKCAHIRSHALGQADPSELMTAVANTLTDLCDRLDRLERYVQTLETRVRGGSLTSDGQAHETPVATKLCPKNDTIAQNQSEETPSRGDHEQSTETTESTNSKPSTESAQRIRDAIAKRSP